MFAPTQTPPFVQTPLHPSTPLLSPQPQHYPCHNTTLEPTNLSTCLDLTSLPAKDDSGSRPQPLPDVTSDLKSTRSLTALRNFPSISTEQGLELMALKKINIRELQFEDQLQLEA